MIVRGSQVPGGNHKVFIKNELHIKRCFFSAGSYQILIKTVH